MEWPERYAAALDLELTAGEVDAILDLARDVAHATERRFAPLSTYVTGQYVARRVAAGASAREALDEAAEVARGLTTAG